MFPLFLQIIVAISEKSFTITFIYHKKTFIYIITNTMIHFMLTIDQNPRTFPKEKKVRGFNFHIPLSARQNKPVQ